MTPEQEAKEKEKFEKKWSFQINLSPSPMWDELNSAVKDLCLTYWLERAKLEYEHLEKITNSAGFTGLLFIEPGCFDEEEK